MSARAGGTTGVTRPSAVPLLGAGLVAGIGAAAAAPPWDLWPLAFVALAPWLVLLSRGPGPWSSAASGALMAAALHLLSCSWILDVLTVHGGMGLALGGASLLASAGIMAPYGALAGLLGGALGARAGVVGLIGLAAAWPALDAVRCRLPLGFPWSVPGMALSAQPRLLSVAELGGVHAVTALVVLANAALAAAWVAVRGRERGGALGVVGVALVVMLASLGWGAARGGPAATPGSRAVLLVGRDGTLVQRGALGAAPGGRRLRAALVQGAAPQEVVLNPDPVADRQRSLVQLELTRAALERGARLVVWSESSHPGTLATVPWLLRELREDLAGPEGAGTAEALTGVLIETADPQGRSVLTNSAVLLDRDGVLGRHDKRYLVPFGEYLPAPWLFFWVEKLSTPLGSLARGGAAEPLTGVHGTVGVTVCYEAILPQLSARLVRHGAEVLANLTNDGWYHGSAAPEQHLRFSAVRAVETRRWVLRCANSGVTAAIDPSGRTRGRLEEGQRGVLLVDVERRTETTVYTRVGDLPAFAAALLVLAWLVSPRGPPEPPQPQVP